MKVGIGVGGSAYGVRVKQDHATSAWREITKKRVTGMVVHRIMRGNRGCNTPR